MTLKNNIYKILENPFIYKLSQNLLAPGAEKKLVKTIQKTINDFQIEGTILDVGCGPASWLWKIKASPVGLDLSYHYSVEYNKRTRKALTGSATALPFAQKTFESVWSIGVLHHLPDSAVKEAIKEMIKVCRPRGSVVIMDAVLPKKNWVRPVAAFIRLLDRGRYMRSQKQLESLLPDSVNWETNRFTYAATGLEMLQCTFKNPEYFK